MVSHNTWGRYYILICWFTTLHLNTWLMEIGCGLEAIQHWLHIIVMYGSLDHIPHLLFSAVVAIIPMVIYYYYIYSLLIFCREQEYS